MDNASSDDPYAVSQRMGRLIARLIARGFTREQIYDGLLFGFIAWCQDLEDNGNAGPVHPSAETKQDALRQVAAHFLHTAELFDTADEEQELTLH